MCTAVAATTTYRSNYNQRMYVEGSIRQDGGFIACCKHLSLPSVVTFSGIVVLACAQDSIKLGGAMRWHGLGALGQTPFILG